MTKNFADNDVMNGPWLFYASDQETPSGARYGDTYSDLHYETVIWGARGPGYGSIADFGHSSNLHEISVARAKAIAAAPEVYATGMRLARIVRLMISIYQKTGVPARKLALALAAFEEAFAKTGLSVHFGCEMCGGRGGVDDRCEGAIESSAPCPYCNGGEPIPEPQAAMPRAAVTIHPDGVTFLVGESTVTVQASEAMIRVVQPDGTVGTISLGFGEIKPAAFGPWRPIDEYEFDEQAGVGETVLVCWRGNSGLRCNAIGTRICGDAETWVRAATGTAIVRPDFFATLPPHAEEYEATAGEPEDPNMLIHDLDPVQVRSGVVDYTAMPTGKMLGWLGDDAAKWAAAFCQHFAAASVQVLDEGWMISWFANAIETACEVRRARDDETGKTPEALAEDQPYASDLTPSEMAIFNRMCGKALSARFAHDADDGGPVYKGVALSEMCAPELYNVLQDIAKLVLLPRQPDDEAGK